MTQDGLRYFFIQGRGKCTHTLKCVKDGEVKEGSKLENLSEGIAEHGNGFPEEVWVSSSLDIFNNNLYNSS